MFGVAIYRFMSNPGPVDPFGGRSMQVQIDTPHFHQADPRWANEELGRSGGTLKAEGCTVCCAAMAFVANVANGNEADPLRLNQQLRENGGFTESGLLIWSALADLAGPDTTVRVKRRFDHEDIDGSLARQQPVIAKVLYLGRIWHWVLIIGKDGQDFLIHDPLSTTFPLLAKDRYPDGFHAIRYLQRK